MEFKQVKTNYITGSLPCTYAAMTSGVVQTYSGHRNVRTFLKEIAFLGNDEYVTTGSDCGNAFVWEKTSGKLVQMLAADESVVNGGSFILFSY